MGADARWVCHTCRTVCYRGGRPIFLSAVCGEMSVSQIDNLERSLVAICEQVLIENQEHIFSFLSDLRRWLSKHEGHNLHVGSDYSTDMMDFGDYYEETVDGKKSVITVNDAHMQSVDAMEETVIREIEGILGKCVAGKKSVRETAEKLYRKFSVGAL